jgi:hypothetical protein
MVLYMTRLPQYGKTALSAAFHGHIAVVKTLLETGATIDIKDIVSYKRYLSFH